MLKEKEFPPVVGEMEILMVQAGLGIGPLLYYWLGNYHGGRPDTHPQVGVWARNVLRYCERYGWIEHPALLARLLGKLASQALGPHAAELPAIRQRLIDEGPPTLFTDRAWDTCQLTTTLPFIGRERTRRAFEHFGNPLAYRPDAARVLVVNGPPGSGKTFTGQFLCMLAARRPQAEGVAAVDFAGWRGKPLSAETLVAELARQIDPDRPVAAGELPASDTQRPERWAKELVVWLAERAALTDRVWTILLDNCHLAGVEASTHVFVEQLLAALAGRPMPWLRDYESDGPPLRLVLLGYTSALKEKTDFVRVDEIDAVTVDDVRAYFDRYAQFRQLPPDPARTAAMAARYATVLPALFTEGPPDTPRHTWPRAKTRELAELIVRDAANLDPQPPAPGAGA